MPLFTKESLQTLREKVDLVEVLQAHVELQAAGAHYKGLCPFHDERSPSFMVQRGDSHYHCFGCGAHGDAIQFLMEYLRMSFYEAVESLAQRFQVNLEYTESTGDPLPQRGKLREMMKEAARLYHFLLLHTEEGHEALRYLQERGISLDLIRRFRVGVSLDQADLLFKTLRHRQYVPEDLAEVGLIKKAQSGKWRDFFIRRIMIPVQDAAGHVVAFSARKYHEETFGGKYVNSPETCLFKKSQLLFGLHYCRRRIAKERRAILVEGQFDALKMIDAGLTVAVATQGTAFGEGHLKQFLDLGVQTVYLALDGDDAGREAAVKIGNLFQKEGVEVLVVPFPDGTDPDFILTKQGMSSLQDLLKGSVPYLTFLVEQYSLRYKVETPAGKNALVREIAQQIRQWGDRIMVHESLRALARLVDVPEDALGVYHAPTPTYVRHTLNARDHSVDADRILESDFLRWLVLYGQEKEALFPLARHNIQPEDLRVQVCIEIYRILLETQSFDLLSLASENPQAQEFIAELTSKKVNPERCEQEFTHTIQRILERNWLEACEEIKTQIHSGKHSEEEVLALAKDFDQLRKNKPSLKT